MEEKMEFVFECDDCKKEFKSWLAIKNHLERNPAHAPVGYGLVNIYRREAENARYDL